MTQWSLPKLRHYLIEEKVVANISIRWLGEILHRYGVRLRRTKTWKESTDPLFKAIAPLFPRKGFISGWPRALPRDNRHSNQRICAYN